MQQRWVTPDDLEARTPDVGPLRAGSLGQHIVVLALALSIGEASGALRAAELIRGLSIQMTYRWLCREALVLEGKAVCLWSVTHHPRERTVAASDVVRRVAGVLLAVAAGLLMVVLSSSLLVLPLALLLHTLGVSAWHAVVLACGVVGVRQLTTGWRAVVAYRVERRRAALMTGDGHQPVWRLDLLGAASPGKGHGGVLLQAFNSRAESAGALVYLVTQEQNIAFYQQHGYRLVDTTGIAAYDGMHLMRRDVDRTVVFLNRTARRASVRQGQLARS
jgi:hypothetical protein